MKIKKMKINKDLKVVTQAPCKCSGKVLKYPAKSADCLYDCTAYNMPSYYGSPCN